MADKYPTQAVPHDPEKKGFGEDLRSANDRGGSGESGGGAYPNPHTGKAGPGDKTGEGSAPEHGGQSNIGYYGPGRLGDKDVEPGGGNLNSGTKKS